MAGISFLASLSLGRSSSLLVVVGGAIAATVLTLFAYRRIPLFGLSRFTAVLLKLAGFYSLIACWIEPQWVTVVPRERANSVALLLDDSRSMQLPDAVSGFTRGGRLIQEWANGAASWRSELEHNFRVRSFAFASSASELGKGFEMNFQGSPTSLASSIADVRERLGDGLAGIILFTDGVSSDTRSFRTAGIPPVFPVVFGRDGSAPDLSLGVVSTTQSAFEDSPVTVAAEVKLSGGRPLHARVRVEPLEPPSPSGASGALSEAWIQLSPQQPTGVVQLQLTPPRSGPTFYTVQVDTNEIRPDAELTLENNRRMVCVNKASGPHRVLYVAGRPNWEFGPLRRAIEGDPEVELRGLIRIAKREPKFSFKGRGGEASNPLFRGFQSGDDADLQRYDKPVVIRVNVDTADELAGGFPKTAEELFSYKGVILDDVESAFFTPDQLRLIQRFVAERGGGMLMLGGMESFEGGGWRGTPIESVLPVWMGKESADESGRQSRRWALTREGLLEPWVRRRTSEAEEVSRIARLPGLEIVNHVEGIKPAAAVLAVASVESERRPALVSQRYGTGRCCALLAGDLFHWGIGDPAQIADLSKLWRQIVRWLVADVPGPVEIAAEWNSATQSARLTVRVRDAAARPVEDADVEVRVRRAGEPENSAIIIRPEAEGEPGSYSAVYSSPASGPLVAEVRAIGAGSLALGRASVGWVQDSSDVEFRSAAPDHAGMENLAKLTGGEVIRIEDLSELPSKLRKIPNLAMESRVRPLWHTGWFFGFALLCLCGEWILRRRNGAA